MAVAPSVEPDAADAAWAHQTVALDTVTRG